jgi:TatD DNase family protein
MLIDSHCHLDDEQFDADREEVIARARAAGVGELLAIGLEAAARLAESHAAIRAAVGIHPHEASKADFDALRVLLAHPKVVAAGEIGLDYHYNFSPPETQREVFARQLDMAAEARLPVIIHAREAWPDTFRILEERWAHASLPGIMHCFSGGWAEAERALAMGFYISFAGVVTFPKAVPIQEAARRVPADRILIETDAPYLAPVPHRGKRNEPAFVASTARKLAELRGVSFEEIAEITAANFKNLFGKHRELEIGPE